MSRFPKLTRLRTAADFAARLAELSVELPFAAELTGAASPLAAPVDTAAGRVGNRFAILPMEGWDGTREGLPTELVERRWRRFGESGAKLIWGGEAVAVRHDGRANPNQLVSSEASLGPLAALREGLVAAHRERYGSADDLVVGLQLTHSGRYARPDGGPSPRTAHTDVCLDGRVGLAGTAREAAVFRDTELEALVADFVAAAVRASRAGFHFVDVKHCHGYLGHELLAAVDREGSFGGSFENRTRFLREVVAGIRSEAPGLAVGVRLSAFDLAPFRPGADGCGEPEPEISPHRFGGDAGGQSIVLDEVHAFLALLQSLGIDLVCTTAGSPYYNPHIQRPAFLPPSDGYAPPEDPLVGVARQIRVTRELRARHPGLVFVGSGYSYLQEWLPHVAEAAVGEGACDLVGLGRMALSYPELPADVLAGRPLQRGVICRTFSDCTTAPRGGLVSGCYPLDPFYKRRPEAEKLTALKQATQKGPARAGAD